MLIFLGTSGAVVTGISLPFMQLLFGEIMDALNGNPVSRFYLVYYRFPAILMYNVLSLV